MPMGEPKDDGSALEKEPAYADGSHVAIGCSSLVGKVESSRVDSTPESTTSVEGNNDLGAFEGPVTADDRQTVAA